MSRLVPFFLLFVLFLSGVLGPSVLAMHDGGKGFDFLICISASTTLALTCSRLGFSPEVISFDSLLPFWSTRSLEIPHAVGCWL